jgi:hypothetical protein
MAKPAAAILVVIVLLGCVSAQNVPSSDPQALAYAAQSIAALTGGTPIADVTLTGNVTWNADADTGTTTLRALGTGESRMDLALSSGTRTEIRDTQTGPPLGQWVSPANKRGNFAPHNCWTDAVWFFPALSSLAAGPNIVLSYLGQTTRAGATLQHVRSYAYLAGQLPVLNPQQLSTMDFYLDAVSFLPVTITFNAHPDNDAGTNLLVEVDLSNYQTIGGIAVPMHIQRYQQGNLMVDLTISGASFNTGLPLSLFTIN